MGRRISRIRVEILPTKEGLSSPQRVFERLKQSVLDDNFQEADQYWIVVDVDHYAEENRIETFIQSVREYNASNKMCIQLAISNPRFEVWLALHKRLDLNKKTIQRLKSSPEELVKEIYPHYTKSFDMSRMTAKSVNIAIEQAEQLDTNKTNDLPDCPGTHVYRLVREILAVIEAK